MRMLRLTTALLPLMLAGTLSACGNKGDLVRPTPPPDQKPATQPQPAASDTTPKPPESGTTPNPVQDSGRH